MMKNQKKLNNLLFESEILFLVFDPTIINCEELDIRIKDNNFFKNILSQIGKYKIHCINCKDICTYEFFFDDLI